ncbi:BTB/POZ domain-containing protein 9-like [Galendromus occidentalis]|uniref:BTB/POZ domain-containing protein 9-like n=1 Tax=Galendromus occidentalis TaxID=34638 RepID=A0AAJ7SHV1_9ACAR|nr:BTB/POZ domain-containing protein 9-like [Galendromus occidentalis]
MEYVKDLAARFGSLLFDSASSDLTLIVEGEALPVHRIILATSCDYFWALFCGRMMESRQSRIILQDISLRGFKHLMRYVYTGDLDLENLESGIILEVLGLANLYGFNVLHDVLVEHIRKNLSLANIVIMSNEANCLQHDQLIDICNQFMDENPDEILKREIFNLLSIETLYGLLSRSSFYAEEIEIFEALREWCSREPQLQGPHVGIMETLRLELIETEDLVNIVGESGLVSKESISEAIQMKRSGAAELRHRGILKSGENFATDENGASRLREIPSECIVTPRACTAYDRDSMPPLNTDLMVRFEEGLVVALRKPFFINKISFKLRDDGLNLYSYYVEVSVNLVDWVRIVDHSKYLCRSYQKLFFEPRVVRYIRVIFTKCFDNKIAHLRRFKASRSKKEITLSHGFHAPEKDVASRGSVIACDAGDDAMIRDPPGWTWHIIGRNSTTIRLSQPFALNRIEMLLAGGDARQYSYYVETSLDKEHWTRVVDRTAEDCRGWQTLSFEMLPMIYIRIVGTASTCGRFFSCTRFSCYAELNPTTAHENQERSGAVSAF